MGNGASFVSFVNDTNIDDDTLTDVKRRIGKGRAVARIKSVDLSTLAVRCAQTMIGRIQEHDPSIESYFRRLFSSLDVDCSGTVDAHEISRALAATSKLTAKEKEFVQFQKICDDANNRFVSFETFEAYARRSGLMCYTKLSAFQPSRDEFDRVVEEIRRDFRTYQEWTTQQIADKPMRPVGFDAETTAAMEAGGIKPSMLRLGHSRCFWDDGGELKIHRNRIFTRAMLACGIDPSSTTLSETQRKVGKSAAMGYLVRLTYEMRNDHNLGAIVLKGMVRKNGGKRPVVLFRSQAMSDVSRPNSCFRHLVDPNIGNVKHVYNVYAGHYPVGEWFDAEKSICQAVREANGATFPVYIDERENESPRRWRSMVDDVDEWTPDNRRKAMELCARQIKDVLNPNGELPEGNILLHCCGGMHRTGMLVAIIRRYVNDDHIDAILDDYKRHVDWKSSDVPGGYEPLNERFIREFDLSILDRMGVRLNLDDSSSSSISTDETSFSSSTESLREEHRIGRCDEWGVIVKPGRCGGRGFTCSINDR